MELPAGPSALNSFEDRQKFGKPNQLGQIFLGHSELGEENDLAGIYRVRHVNGRRVREKLPFYEPTNPQTEAQQSNRATFADAVAAWQSLTTEQKAVYNTRAVGKNLFGYHLFIREYMLSN